MPSQKNILISGAVAFDTIFSVTSDFRDQMRVKDGAVDHFNAMYIAGDKQEYHGGTGGNISFWLGRSGASHHLFSAWGQDFEQKGYAAKLREMGAEIRGTVRDYTAHAYMISDPHHQQLQIWQSNAYAANEEHFLTDFYSPQELAAFDLALFCTGTARSILAQMETLRAHNPEVFIIFDPGQQTPLFSREQMQACVALADATVANHIEWSYIPADIFDAAHIRICTRGAQGVDIRGGGIALDLPAQSVTSVVETTGAGDAFRGGLLSGLARGMNWEDAAKLGTAAGAHCVQLPSGQI